MANAFTFHYDRNFENPRVTLDGEFKKKLALAFKKTLSRKGITLDELREVTEILSKIDKCYSQSKTKNI